MRATEKAIADKLARFPHKNNSQINCMFSGAQRVGAAAIAAVRAKMVGGGKLASTSQLAPKKSKGKSLADFAAVYDKDTIIPSKIKAALKSLGNSWEYERDFVSRAGVTYTDLGNYREMFAEHVVTIKRDSKRVWAGTVEFAEQIRDMV